MRLRDLAYRTSQGGQSHAAVSIVPKPVRILDDAIALNLFRIAQEAVTNALKHAKPKLIVISLKRSGRALILAVTDDGKGLPAKRTSGGMGISIMQHRANVVGAKLTVEARRVGGTMRDLHVIASLKVAVAVGPMVPAVESLLPVWTSQRYCRL